MSTTSRLFDTPGLLMLVSLTGLVLIREALLLREFISLGDRSAPSVSRRLVRAATGPLVNGGHDGRS
jgi:hypothetical protein